MSPVETNELDISPYGQRVCYGSGDHVTPQQICHQLLVSCWRNCLLTHSAISCLLNKLLQLDIIKTLVQFIVLQGILTQKISVRTSR